MPKYPIKLRGETWWDEFRQHRQFKLFHLFADRLSFEVDDDTEYRGSLDLTRTGDGRFAGKFDFVKDGRPLTGKAHCRLWLESGEYRLEGTWDQPAIKSLAWHGILEPIEE